MIECPRVARIRRGYNTVDMLPTTTRQHNAHRTDEREVFYPWHPWFGLRVFVHEVVARGSARAFRCAETKNLIIGTHNDEKRKKPPNGNAKFAGMVRRRCGVIGIASDPRHLLT